MRSAPALRSLLAGGPTFALSGLALLLLAAPFVGLVLSSTTADLWSALSHPLFVPALGLSLWTTTISVGLMILLGTPLAWLLSRSDSAWSRVVTAGVNLPLVVPPAVLGIGLLLVVSPSTPLGGLLTGLGVQISFTSLAVVLAQTVVAAPLYVLGAAQAFARVDPELLAVARTLGASRVGSFWRVALPISLPGMVGAAALAWARALGEFGATLLFAGSLTGRTQTMPLAIYRALEEDLDVAIALSLVLTVCALVALLGLLLLPRRSLTS